MTEKSLRILVSGRVQGVFFRQAMKAQAVLNSVRGWVRNLEDGRVEAVLEGEAGGVDALAEWCRRGPANAIVQDVEIRPETYTGRFSGFDVLYQTAS